MSAVNALGARWPEAVVDTQREIEATNARIEKEWDRLRAADAGLPERRPRLDAGGLEVEAGEGPRAIRPRWLARRLAEDYEWQVEAVRLRTNAIRLRLEVIGRWLDRVMERLPEGPGLRDEDVVAVLSSVSPSVEEVAALFEEIQDNIREIRSLIRGIKHPVRRAAGRILRALMFCAAGALLGAGLAVLADWIDKT